jgi:hypothetical protein
MALSGMPADWALQSSQSANGKARKYALLLILVVLWHI